MPITSSQAGGMIGGQLGMFGNFASYANQISPGMAGAGAMPTYSNPMGQGAGMAFQPPPPPGFTNYDSQATGIMGAAGSMVPGIMGAATLAGSFLPGMAGRAFGAMDPFSAGLGGVLRGSGLAAGVTSEMGLMARLGTYGGNMGRIAGGGFGSIARAGIGGLGGGMLAAAGPMAIQAGVGYAVGQMVEGAQFQNQVGSVLQQNFRHLNPGAQNGLGFSRSDTGQVTNMIRDMSGGMSSPQELLRIMQQGAASGSFSAVRDVHEFKKKFTDMVGSLKEVAKVMSTTLEGAMPFLQDMKKMGMWTPGDIQRGANMARTASQASGLSVAETAGMMSQGAAMARSVGAMGMTGAAGMAQSLGLVGGGLRSNVISERALSEATGGLTGSEAVGSLAGILQQGTTRFATSGRARWLLASMANKGMTGLDSGKLGMLASGAYSLGDIRGMAERNVSGRGADFVMGEEDMRGDLIKQGPMAQLGLIKTLAGSRLYGNSGMDKLITRRMMKQNFGIEGRQADIMAELARNLPQIMRENQQRTDASIDQENRNRDELMNHSYEGLKRKIGEKWNKAVSDPLQKIGADLSRGISSYIENVSDRIWGRASSGMQFRGVQGDALAAYRSAAGGDSGAMYKQFGSSEEYEKKVRELRGGGVEASKKADIVHAALYGVKAENAAEMKKFQLQMQASKGGSMTSDQLNALGFGSQDEAEGAFAKAQEGLQSVAAKRLVMSMREAGKSDREIQQALVKQGQAGELGEGVKALVKGGGSGAVARLLAAQTDSQRKSRSSLGGMGPGEGKPGAAEDFQKSAADLEKEMKSIMTDAVSASSSWYELENDKTDALMDLAKNPETKDKFDRLMKNVDPSDPKAAEKLEKALMDLADDPAVGEKASQSLRDMADKAKTDPRIVDNFGKLAGNARNRTMGAAKEVFNQRNERLKKGMEEMGAGLQDMLAGVKDKSGKSLGIDKKIQAIANETDPDKRQALLADLAHTASKASKEDVLRIQGVMSEASGGADVAGALGGAVEGHRLRDTFDGGSMKDKRAALSEAAGMTFTDKQFNRIMKGDKSVIAELLKGETDATTRKNKELLLKGAGGGKAGLTDMLEGSTNLAAMRAAASGLGIDNFVNKAKAGELQGKIGSNEGMHGTMMRIQQVLEEMQKGGDKVGTKKDGETP